MKTPAWAERQGYRAEHTHYVGTIHRGRNLDGSLRDFWTEAR